MGGILGRSSDADDPTTSEPKKAKGINLGDPYAVKRHLDDVASEIILQRGYREDVSLSNLKMGVGLLACAVALLAQFYPMPFPDNRNFLIVCIIIYVALNLALSAIAFLKENNNILFTHPQTGTFTQPGLAVSSTLTRFSDSYTIRIASSDPTSIAAPPPVELTKSVTGWFTADGVLAEDIFLEDLEKLMTEYEEEGESRKSK